MRDYSPRGPHAAKPRRRAKKKITDMHLLEAAKSDTSACQYFLERGECREVSTRALERGYKQGVIDCNSLGMAMLTFKGKALLIELIDNGAVLSPGLELRAGLDRGRPNLLPWLGKARSNGAAMTLDQSTEIVGSSLVPRRL